MLKLFFGIDICDIILFVYFFYFNFTMLMLFLYIEPLNNYI